MTSETTLSNSVIEDAQKLLHREDEFNSLVYMPISAERVLAERAPPRWDFNNPPTDINQLALDLIATMTHHELVSLSATQVGLPYNVFVLKSSPPFVCINPNIVWVSDGTETLEEASPNFPGIVTSITRAAHIRLRFATPSGVITTKTFTGVTARVIQHEVECLEGKQFFDGIGRMRMEKALKRAAKLGYDYSRHNLMKRAVHF